MPPGRCFFILTTARSGSTSLAKILDEAPHGTCAVEPMPNLNTETRLAMDGRLVDPADHDALVHDVLVTRVEREWRHRTVYGEKNLTYGPFVPAMERAFGDRARYVLIHRDGRDVVRSLIDWHDRMFGDIYRECRETGHVAPRAVTAAANLPVHLDTSDFSRPRPRPGTAAHAAWEGMRRAEMCAWYWAFINDLYADRLAELPEGRSITIDYTAPTSDAVQRVAAFVGLDDLSNETVESMLGARINSLSDRIGETDTSPRWPSWHGGQRRDFEHLAGATMQRFGYMTDHAWRWHPRGRASAVSSAEHPDAAAAVDAWARDRGASPTRLRAGDLAEAIAGRGERSAVAVTADALDTAHDVEVVLDALVDRAPGGAVCAVSSRGWNEGLAEHAYRWNEERGAHDTCLAPTRVREHLERRGCTDVVVEPIGGSSGRMTRITARTPAAVGGAA